MKILHVLAPGLFGGLESVVTMLTSGLNAGPHAVRVIAVLDLEPDPHPFVDSLVAAGVDVESIRISGRSYLRERRALMDAITRFGPHVVHTHGYREDFQAGAIAQRVGIPTASTVHGFTGGDYKNRVFEWLQIRALRQFDGVIAVSRPMVDFLRNSGIPTNRLHLVPNAWSGRASGLTAHAARRELGLASEPFVVGWVGRLSIEKGADVLVRALAELRDPTLIACIVGDGPERGALESLAHSLGVSDRVHWPGAVPDAARIFSAFDLFALSSRTEGTPISLFEAIDAEIPVVASAVGGVPDVVSPSEAWLVSPDDPTALSNAFENIRSDREEAKRRARSAQTRLASEFGVDQWVHSHEEIYEALLGSSHPEAREAASR